MVLEYTTEIVTNSHYLAGETINSRVLDLINTIDEPFFVWAHYMDVHSPYNRFKTYHFGEGKIGRRKLQLLCRRAKYLPSTISDEERQTLVDAYNNAIRQFDRTMNELITELEQRGLLDETTVILTADHGEAFGEHDIYEHRRFLYEELLRVPLLVLDPDRNGRTITRKVSTIDIAPMIRERTGTLDHRADEGSIYERTDDPIKSSCIKSFQRKTRFI